jgi:oxygen-dependent protoporphyrinogen oxidase
MSAVTTQSPAQKRSVGIIGAGITGLTAAFRLKQLGIDVVVYEAEQRVGGVIRSNPRKRLSGRIRSQFDSRDFRKRSCRSYAMSASKAADCTRMQKLKTVIWFATDGPLCCRFSPLKFFGTELFSAKAKLSLLVEPVQATCCA